MDVFQNKVATELFIFSFYEWEPGQVRGAGTVG